MSSIAELEDVSRSFPGSPPVEAVRNANLSVAEGDYVAIVGPSGSGKSTLLNIVGCLDTPTGGNYRLLGLNTNSLGDGLRTSLRGSEIGFVFQAFHLLPYRSVVENVMTGLVYNRTPRRVRKQLALEALERVGLSHRLDFTPQKLSGGERQRVAIARAIAGRPSLLLCDEPTGNLDTKTTVAILDLFDELRTDGLTLMVITHEERVSQRAERRVEMVDGLLTEVVAS